jgi:tetratricopeptide (TPR) repeat protein
VSVSLNKLGDFLSQRGQTGDAERALAAYERDLEISEKLLAANPESAQAARDVSVSLDRLGDFLSKRGQTGDAERALAGYERSLEVREKLLATNPQSAQAARDVSVSLNNLGDFLSKRGQAGDAERALAGYERSLEVAEKLLAANPQSAETARDVAWGLSNLGDLLSRRAQAGDGERALVGYERSLEISEKLLAANPQSAEAARDLVVSHYKMSVYCRKQGNAAGREKHDRACYDLLHGCISQGMTFDRPVLEMHEQLRALFGGR